MTMRLKWATLCREPELSMKASLVRCPVAMVNLEARIPFGYYLASLGSLPKGTRTLSVAVNGKAKLIFTIAGKVKKKKTIVDGLFFLAPRTG